jgi:predicted porin
MIGGLMKKTSLIAIAAAAASVFSTNAMAADLGGDCCADLEERIAELEATTVRKGNRKVSLEVSGQVNELVFYWDDGVESNVYQATNTFSSSRFRMKGTAKINDEWSAGYLIEIDFEGAIGAGVDQNTDDTSRQPRLRHSAWQLKSKRLGAIWVGQYSVATDDITAAVDVAGIGTAAAANMNSSAGAGLFHRNSNGTLTNTRLNAFWQFLDTDRQNIIRYDSPTLAGFTLSAAWGEDDVWDVALRYAGEFNGIKMAAALGYYEDRDESSAAIVRNGASQNFDDIRAAASVLHEPTGLFVNGAYIHREFDNVALGDVTYWYLASGISRKFFPIGKTAIWGEYAEIDGPLDGNIVTAGNNFAGLAVGATIIDSQQSHWGIGVQQYIDAAAMQVYLGYRNIEADVSTAAASTNFNDIDIVYTGARIQF